MADNSPNTNVENTNKVAPTAPVSTAVPADAGGVDVKKEKKKHLIRPIRTYKDDVSRFVKQGKISTSKIVLAEQKRRQEKARRTQAANALAKKKQAKLMKKLAKSDRGAYELALKNEADLQRKRRAEMTEEELAAEKLASGEGNIPEEKPDLTPVGVTKVMPQDPSLLASEKDMRPPVNWAKTLLIFFIIIGVVAIASTFVFFDPLKMIGDILPGNSNRGSGGDILDSSFIRDRGEIQILTDDRISSRIKGEVITNISNPPETEKGGVVELKLLETVATVVENEEIVDVVSKISSERFMSIMELNAPDYMVRSLDPADYLFGMINLGKGSEAVPFLLFKTTDFERVFSGLLEWEISMFRDVNDIFFKTLGVNDFVTSSSDAGFSPNKLQDVTISNRDARAIVDNENDILFFYTFLNNDYLLMSSEKGVVAELSRKLTLQNLVR